MTPEEKEVAGLRATIRKLKLKHKEEIHSLKSSHKKDVAMYEVLVMAMSKRILKG